MALLKKAFSGGLDALLRPPSGLPPAIRAGADESGPEAEEWGSWHYLVTDAAGIRPRLDACYSRETKRHDRRFMPGTIVEVDKRRRSGWTRWLSIASGEGWLFDISPKDRKVRMVEVEVQLGEFEYEVCAEPLTVLPCPFLGAPSQPQLGSVLHVGDFVTAVERVRPLHGRGAFLRLAEVDGWVFDFVDGCQMLRRRRMPAGNDAPLAALALKRDPESALGEPQRGLWRYVVLDPKGLTLRGKPTYDQSEKLKLRIEEGEVVDVVERRVGADTMFLRFEGPGGRTGWAFDVQPGPQPYARLMEVHVDEGTWFYRVVCDRGCALRSRCSTSDSSKVGNGPEKGALVRVGQRAKVGSTTFLRLKDDSGWIFDRKDGRQIVEGPLDVQQMRGAAATVVAPEGVVLLKSPTSESWARTKMVLLRDGKVQVGLKANVDGVFWMEVSKVGSMQGWVPAETLELDPLFMR